MHRVYQRRSAAKSRCCTRCPSSSPFSSPPTASSPIRSR
jgi:hypothetical protein